MIVVTGAAGFIGSCLVRKLNKKGYEDIAIVDDFSNSSKSNNLKGKIYTKRINRNTFFDWFKDNYQYVDFVFHLGARTDTTEKNKAIFDELNLNYSKSMWNSCVEYSIPLIYASSAATYGNGDYGFIDDQSLIPNLKPLNEYGISKNEFDKWILKQEQTPPQWAGLKFFNVYGPNEYHKGRMASVVFHAYNQILEKGKMTLFRSHNPEYKDGEQLRDFIYVKDISKVCLHLMTNRFDSGIYNLGTGKARTFLDLANALFKSMGKEPVIEFIDTPEDIRDKYQYFTQADMTRFNTLGYNKSFYTLEEGIKSYVQKHLSLNLNY